MKPILIIAPFEDMYYMAMDVASEFDCVDVQLATLDEAVKVAREKTSEGIEIIISRGGTYKALKNSGLNVPIVEIQVSPYDILDAIHKAKKIGKNICVIGFDNIINGVENLGPILDVNLITYNINSRYEAEKALREATYNNKIDVVLGGSLAEQMADDHGINTVFLYTSSIVIRQSILEAINILNIKRKEIEKAERYKTILDNINEGIISIDKEGQIIIYNSSAEKTIGIRKEKALGENIFNVFENKNLIRILTNDKSEFGQLVMDENKVLFINKVLIHIKDEVSGAVATFNDITKIQEYEQIIRSSIREKGHLAKYNFTDMIGSSKEIIKCKDKAYKYSRVDSNILIIGETGTGKEMFAQSIHNNSPRRGGPFVAVNCASIPENLLESELFGYEGGAFTDAKKDGRLGLFAMAHTGTIFLDEIAETSIEFQSRLLRVLQEKEIRPVGSNKVIPIDVRVISATNKSLIEEVNKGKFRRDLFYRLNVLLLYLPALKDRIEDIELLCNNFIEKQNKLLSKELRLSDSVLEVLKSYHWPGNIRELHNVIERLSIIHDGILTSESISDILEEYSETPNIEVDSLKGLEIEYINRIIKECNGNKTEAAKRLGISRTQLWRKLKA